MKFVSIDESSKVFPGEYLLYEPSQIIVLCGAFNRSNDMIRAFGQGRYIEDKINNFKKIDMDPNEHKEHYRSRCKGCGG
jgi:hypothetical protein|tara:strand:+ start:1718 stop:1954 length:237 start_codon:yes stop_codon:yes gene_type:complete